MAKGEEIKVRVTSAVKAQVVALARQRDEGESVVVREAINEYLARRSNSLRPKATVDPVAQAQIEASAQQRLARRSRRHDRAS